jgi:hypothetical protein
MSSIESTTATRPARRRWSRRTIPIVGLVAVLLVAVAVGYAGLSTRGERLPDPNAFRPGSCRSVAEPVIALARMDPHLRSARTVSASQRAELSHQQKVLQAARAGAEPTVADSLDHLVDAIGWIRLRSDTGTYDPRLWRDVNDRRHDLQRTCTS